jgi:hypothetical protein
MKLSGKEQTDFLKRLGIDPDLPPADVLLLVKEARARLSAIAQKAEPSGPQGVVPDVQILLCDMVRASRELKARASKA